jgi:hypothetical protein
MSKHPTEKSSDDINDLYGIPESDVDAWAERERKRRQAWVDGPSEEEKREWAKAERRRRTRDDLEDFVYDEAEENADEVRRILVRMQRNASPALVMLANMLFDAPHRTVGGLLHEAREWDEERYGPPGRRRVHLDDDD